MLNNLKVKFKENENKFTKIDFIILISITLIYALFSFYRLGDTKVPNTYKTFDLNESIVLELKDETDITKMRYYTGNKPGKFTFAFSSDGENYSVPLEVKVEYVFNWLDFININETAKYIKITCDIEGSTLGDIQFYNDDLKLSYITKNALTDELNLVPDEISSLNSAYFDEIYYARTVYEYTNGLTAFEWTHPPLGKLLMSIPVLLFGFSPFTYRMMGNIAGILIIPVMYLLAKNIFKKRKYAILGALLMMFDNFHFVHTRTALIDSYQILFILLSVLFMKYYLDLNGDLSKKKIKYLLLSGTFIGCALTTKWNALYIYVALFIVFLVHLLKSYNFSLKKIIKKLEFNQVLKYLGFIIYPIAIYFLIFLITDKKIALVILLTYIVIIVFYILYKIGKLLMNDSNLSKLVIVWFISFVFIPVIIYFSSYLLFPKLDKYNGTLIGVVDTNIEMYKFHSTLESPHPFSSKWYTWIFMYRPVWFYSRMAANNKVMTISDIGNPMIWWFGIISFIYLIINTIKKRNKNSIFILIFILCSYIPYVFIGRVMFMYHYFITLPFIMLGIVSFIKWITEKTKSNKFYYYYLILIILTFFIFYPVTSGLPVSRDYLDVIKWLKGWTF